MHFIADELGCTYTQVRYWAIKGGLKPAKADGKQQRPQKNPEEWSRILKQAYANRWPEGRTGKEAGNWKGGRSKHPIGWLIYTPEHPKRLEIMAE